MRGGVYFRGLAGAILVKSGLLGNRFVKNVPPL